MNERVAKRESIISFYDSIADKYDSQLTDADEKARVEISAIFRKSVASGTVLDFGSGTGLDLPWLLSSGYDVIALEPSVAMRNVALKKYSGQMVHFVNENLDYGLWSLQQLPFDKKVDGILANFAVLNCIKNISDFFEKAAMVAKPNAHVVITVIDPLFTSMMKNYSLLLAVRLFWFGSLVVWNKNDGIYHQTYLHGISAIRKASQKHFTIKSIQQIRFSNFMTITLSRNETNA